MKLSISKEGVVSYLLRQLNNLFPDGNEVKKGTLEKYSDEIFERTEYCFSKIDLPYFFDGENVLFNHLNGDHYAMFLYFACNTIYRNGGDTATATKIFALNKMLHGVDAFYEVELPDIFLFIHPLGTVLGRGKYSDYFLAYQRCNVGANRGVYPTMGKNFSMHPGSAILGDCKIEDNCTLAAGSLLIGKNMEKNSLYIGNPKSFIVKKGQAKEFWR